MNAEQRQIVQPLLNLINQIDPEAGAEFSAHIENILDEDLAQALSYLPTVDRLAYFWQGSWKQVARAWLLVSMLQGPIKPTYQLELGELTQYLNQIRHSSEAQVRVSLLALLTQAQVAQSAIAEITSILTDPSRDEWEPTRFTDPNEHRRDDYRYIITALRPTSMTVTDPAEIAYLEEHRKLYVRRDPSNRARLLFNITAYYLGDPTCLWHEVLSCSLISHLKNKTYQNMSFGFVLHVPKNNICAAGNTDLVAATVQHTARGQILARLTRHQRKLKVTDFLEQLAGKAKRNLPTPDHILRTTTVSGHNELIVVGSFLGQVRARALFIKVTRDNKLWQSFVTADGESSLSHLIFGCSTRHGLPIIPITDDRDAASSVDFDAWLAQRTAMPGRSSLSDERALVAIMQQPIENERMRRANIHIKLGQARALLGRHLQVSPFSDLPSLHRAFREFSRTHHSDRTRDEEKIEKFKLVSGLLELVKKAEEESGPPRMITGPGSRSDE
jgi:hypothetical protein